MAEYGAYQLSLKAGQDMLNIAAKDADELRERADAVFGDGTGSELLAKFFVSALLTPVPAVNITTTPLPQSLSQTSGGARSGDQPSEKQIAFAGKLGIQGAAGMSKRELSAAIDAKTKK